MKLTPSQTEEQANKLAYEANEIARTQSRRTQAYAGIAALAAAVSAVCSVMLLIKAPPL